MSSKPSHVAPVGGEEVPFRALCDSLGFAVIATDDQRRIHYWNSAADRLLGARASAMVGQDVLAIFPESAREEAQRILQNALTEGSNDVFEYEQGDTTGRARLWVGVVSPVLGSDGRPVGASICVRDITDRREVSRQKARSQRMESLGKMAGGVAHHFNSILGGVATKIDFMLSTMHPRDKLRKDFEKLAEAVGRAARISGQLMTFAEGEHDPGFPRELTLVLTEFVDSHRAALEQLGIRVRFDSEPIQPTQVESKRMQGVLESLMHNSIDAMKQGGEFGVGLKERDHEALVTVWDTGGGIPAEKLERVFEPFFTTKGELGGGAGRNTGLSLSVVHSFVADMGGWIEVQSDPGKGTTFLIHLPLGTRDAAKRRA